MVFAYIKQKKKKVIVNTIYEMAVVAKCLIIHGMRANIRTASKKKNG